MLYLLDIAEIKCYSSIGKRAWSSEICDHGHRELYLRKRKLSSGFWGRFWRKLPFITEYLTKHHHSLIVNVSLIVVAILILPALKEKSFGIGFKLVGSAGSGNQRVMIKMENIFQNEKYLADFQIWVGNMMQFLLKSFFPAASAGLQQLALSGTYMVYFITLLLIVS